jgi:hypothetical protein
MFEIIGLGLGLTGEYHIVKSTIATTDKFEKKMLYDMNQARLREIQAAKKVLIAYGYDKPRR